MCEAAFAPWMADPSDEAVSYLLLLASASPRTLQPESTSPTNCLKGDEGGGGGGPGRWRSRRARSPSAAASPAAMSPPPVVAVDAAATASCDGSSSCDNENYARYRIFSGQDCCLPTWMVPGSAHCGFCAHIRHARLALGRAHEICIMASRKRVASFWVAFELLSNGNRFRPCRSRGCLDLSPFPLMCTLLPSHAVSLNNLRHALLLLSRSVNSAQDFDLHPPHVTPLSPPSGFEAPRCTCGKSLCSCTLVH
jgi:hypothetical protein